MTLFPQNRLFRICLPLSIVSALLIGVAAVRLPALTRGTAEGMVLGAHRQQVAPRVERLLAALQETVEEQRLLKTIRPPAESPVSFLTSLEGIATRSGVRQTIAAIPKEAERPETTYTYVAPVVRYRVTLEGTLEAVARYLREVGSGPHLVAVEHLEVAPLPGGDLTGEVTTTAVLAVAVRETSSP